MRDLLDDLMDVVGKCVSPIWTSESIHESPASVRASGTCCFVDTGSRKLLVTADHVFRDYEERRRAEPSTVLSVMVGDGQCATIDQPEILDRSQLMDLIVLNWPHLMERENSEKLYFPIRAWPIPRVRRGEQVIIVGYPGKWRVGAQAFGSFEPLGLCYRASNSEGRTVWLVDEESSWRMQSHGRVVQESVDPGGISGSAGFFIRNQIPHLAGIVYECNIGGNMVALTSGSSLTKDGQICDPF